MNKRKSFLKKKKKASGDVSLQITSMADIFMILLVFLLKNYAVSVTNISPSVQISLPEISKGKTNPKESVKIEISKDIVMVDQKPAVKLNNFKFDTTETPEDGKSPSLIKAFTGQRQMKPDANLDSSVIVMADQLTPYDTIKRVVASAASVGFVDLQLVVVEQE